MAEHVLAKHEARFRLPLAAQRFTILTSFTSQMISKILIENKIKELAGKPWFPLDVARVNDQAVRLALFKGDYRWHTHEEDEFFLIYKGEITIQLKDQSNIELKTGEIAVVPKGMEHCPKSKGESYVLMFEPLNLKSAGN